MMPKITLKAARVNAGMTQDEAAGFLGKTKQTIVNWENGVTEIKYRDLCLEYLKLPVKREKE